jgi:hypothetical protein
VARSSEGSKSTVEQISEAFGLALAADRREAEARRELEAHERRRADSVKFITAVVSAAPKFNGSGILGFWESAIKQHMTLSQVKPE